MFPGVSLASMTELQGLMQSWLVPYCIKWYLDLCSQIHTNVSKCMDRHIRRLPFSSVMTERGDGARELCTFSAAASLKTVNDAPDPAWLCPENGVVVGPGETDERATAKELLR